MKESQKTHICQLQADVGHRRIKIMEMWATARVRVSLHCRNATQPVTLVVRFGPKQPEVRKSLACASEAGAEAEVDLPASQFTVRKLRAYVEVERSDGALRAVSPRFTVRLPKP